MDPVFDPRNIAGQLLLPSRQIPQNQILRFRYVNPDQTSVFQFPGQLPAVNTVVFVVTLPSTCRHVGRIDHYVFHSQFAQRPMRFKTAESSFIHASIFRFRIVPFQILSQFLRIRIHTEVVQLHSAMPRADLPTLLMHVNSAINHLTFERYRATFLPHG